ncbi:metallophosphoesterase [Sphingomonas sp. NSE70-1]|uniref:Metallophosphoesterase n=1 Tax=Sphingomonas caseinilyticus TaxID=2908205 RepID=A0ABT0RVE7_9SPHN|nr:metallophosphoesterase [Sphingomonas caseinilyticus]MCL6698670.1 metallophosphoesterase [Sphingomonas caseinilyticus]
MPSNYKLRMLHFSDMHIGMKELREKWPRSDYALSADLEKSIKRMGGCDLIIFSGDLAFSGVSEQYDQFYEKISRISARINELGGESQLIVVPGNHDLLRPDALAPPAYALSQYWRDASLRDRFWSDSEGYRQFIKSVFENFSQFQSKLIADGVHLAPHTTGILPGDASYIFEAKGHSTGVVALNSAWLQIGAGNYHQQLDVDVRQLLAVTNDAPDDWVSGHGANFLVTHHPPNWLHPQSAEQWENDINPSGRFDAHLFGHMHEPASMTIAFGGSLSKRSVQAPSLFGMETFGDGSLQRIQGYSGSLLEVGSSGRTLTTWPRRLVKTADGAWKFAPDTSQDIDEDTGSYSLTYEVQKNTLKEELSPNNSIRAEKWNDSFPASDDDLSKSFELDLIRLKIQESKGHRNVRKVEQRSCITSFRESRRAWVVADWGMGEIGFLSSLTHQIGVDIGSIFRIDFSQYVGRNDFLDGLKTRLGSDFHDICSAIADNGPSIVFLDDVPTTTENDGESSAVEKDIDQLTDLISDFAPESFVFVRSRRRPSFISNAIELKPLDEADVAIYVREAEGGQDKYAKPNSVALLFRHTNGVPTRLDAALRDLEIVSVDDLIEANPDIVNNIAHAADVPDSLVVTVAELSNSDDRLEKRSYDLLLALSALPQGEQLSRLKRFLGPHPFHPTHARSLLERALIDTVPLTGLNDPEKNEDAKALMVPRVVREYIRETLDEATESSIDRRALDLYFGSDWATGDIARSPTGKRISNPLADSYEIENSGTLILRQARRAIGEGSSLSIESALRLAVSFVANLMHGDHFRAAASFCEAFFHIAEGVNCLDDQLEVLKFEYGRSLRMSGRASEARSTLEGLNLASLSKSQRQIAELSLALCCEKLGDKPAAAEAAERAIAIDKSSSPALQARVILAEQIEDDELRRSELRSLLAQAQTRSSPIVANNLLITLADEGEDNTMESEDLLRQVVSNTNSDFYNGARAIVSLANLVGDPAELTSDERDKLIKSYHFLHNERLFHLFNRCHSALWRLFESNGDTENLLNLFRHSSFIWRLNGSEKKELEYLAKLTRMANSLIQRDVRKVSRDGAYFVVRVSVVLGQDVIEAAAKSNTKSDLETGPG